MRQPRILTFNFHEPYLCLMAHTGLRMDVGLYEQGVLARAWQHHYRPLPPTLTLLPEAEWRARLARGGYDVLIAHNEMNAIDVHRAPAAKIMVQHNRRRFLETTASADDGDPVQRFGEMIELLRQAYSFVYISESKRAGFGGAGRIILPGIDVEAYGGYTGETAAILRVGNAMRARTKMFDVPFQERVCAGLPHRIAGVNPGLPGAAPADSFDGLLRLYRTHRCLLHVTREEFEDGYNLAMLEAMACGMPVVSLANATSPLTDGVDGFVSPDAEVLRARIRALLDDRDRAAAIGARGRETAARRFPMGAFVEAWREAIFIEAETTPYAAGDPKAGAAARPKALVHYVASPITTARYLARALAREAEVRTTGFRVPEAVLALWGFAGTPPPYPAQQIPLRPSGSYRELLDALPAGYRPDFYLWIDSGPKRVEPGLGVLPCPKAAYLIDTHIAPDLRLAMAAQFDIVFLAQLGQVEAFRKAGVRHVHWLPLACDPDLHAVPPAPRDLDWSYVGSLNAEESDRRRNLLERMQARFPNCFAGKAWPHEMAALYARSKIVINVAVQRDVNMRVFEAMAAGALLITDEAGGLEELFEDGVHCVIYRRDEEVFDLVARYLADGAARGRIAAAGRARVLAEHTYAHRVRAMLAQIRETLPTMTTPGADAMPADKPEHYYQNAREEVLERVPRFARRILDVGCGAGVLGRALKERRGAEFVAGIEIVEPVAREARKVLDHVLVGSIEALELPFEDGFFDCIVCADVLEHLAEPEAALAKLARVLAKDGIVVISIPNVQFAEVVSMVACGQFNYFDAGITDATHLRFFTRAEVARLVRAAGLEPCHVGPLSLLREDLLPRSPEGTVTMQGLEISAVSDLEYEDLRTYQFAALCGHAGADRLARARAALEAGSFDTAAALAAEAVGVDECDRRRIAGMALARLGRLDEAVSHYAEAWSIDPQPDLAERYGILLLALNRGAEAEPLLARALEAKPDSERAAGALGLLRLGQHRYAEAFALLRRALEASFAHEGLVKPLIACAEETGQLAGAIPLVQAYAEFYPGSAELACDLAAALMAAGRNAEARERLEFAGIFHAGHPRIDALRAHLDETA